MQNMINRTQAHLYEYLKQSGEATHEIDYRYEHSLRVANIGLKLAEAEGADKKVVVLGCLLHDLGKFESEKGIDHGRVSAERAKPFLSSLSLSQKEINDICYAIAVHVDGKAGYDYPEILEAKIVTDADNIDRFSYSKILQAKLWEFEEGPLTLEVRRKRIKSKLDKLSSYKASNILETKSGNALFKTKVVEQIHFFSVLLKDLSMTKEPEWR